MSTLNVQTPDVLTRVSEYIPEIIEYIEGIIRNKYAYVTKDGSVSLYSPVEAIHETLGLLRHACLQLQSETLVREAGSFGVRGYRQPGYAEAYARERRRA